MAGLAKGPLTKAINHALRRGPLSPKRGGGKVAAAMTVLGIAGLVAYFDPADLDTCYSDFNMTTKAARDGTATVAALADKSGNNYHAKKLATGNRPGLLFRPASNRPYLNFDADDVLTSTVPGWSGCTVVRSIPGVGASIQTNVTIGTSMNQSITNAGTLVFNRALTSAETAFVTTWAENKAGIHDVFNVAYGADTTNELFDFYPANGHPNSPMFVMVHGGGWRNGDKLLANVILNKFQWLLSLGISCASVNYKLDVGTDPVTVQAPSVAKAFKKLIDLAPSNGVNPKYIVFAGHSAGAHLTNLATSSDAIRDAAGLSSQGWAGTLLLDSAAYDLVNIMTAPGGHLSLYDEPWGVDPQKWHDGSPALIMASRLPPTMCVVSQTGGPHGESDAENTAEWTNLATSLGTVVTVRNTVLAHGELNDQLGLTPAVGDSVTDATYTSDVRAWLATLGI